MTCLRSKDMENGQCRDLSKAYLKCRMENNLMTKEDWKFLGYKDGEPTSGDNNLEHKAPSSK